MKQKYKERIAYLYKKKPYIKDQAKAYSDSDTHNTDGIPFYCNVIEKTRSIEVPMSNAYRTVTETVVLTSAQLNFEEHDRITFEKYPENNVDFEDYSSIVSARQKPILEQGRKYRKQDYYEWELRIS